MSIFNIFGRGQTGGGIRRRGVEAYQSALGGSAMARGLRGALGTPGHLENRVKNAYADAGIPQNQIFNYSGNKASQQPVRQGTTAAAESDPTSGDFQVPQSQEDILAQQVAATNRSAEFQRQNMGAIQSQLSRRSAQMNALRGGSGFSGMAQSGAAQAALSSMGMSNDIEARRNAIFNALFGQYGNVLRDRMYTPTVEDTFTLQEADYDLSGLPSSI